MEVDYEFCRTAKLTPVDLLVWLDIIDSIKDDQWNIHIFGRWLRIYGSTVEISEPFSTFDRWSNSIEFELDLAKGSQRRDFVNYIEKQRFLELAELLS